MIEVVDVMGDDLAVANAARVSFDKRKDHFDDADAKLIRYLATNEHTTPFRHPQVSLRCSAPLFLARQLGKHQIGLSWNEVSRRYVDDDPEFYYPDEWRSRPDKSIKQGSGDLFEDQLWAKSKYDIILEECKYAYRTMLKVGVAPEMARMVLPQSMITSWVWTGSLMAFFHVWRLRSDPHAQQEARAFAKELDLIMMDLFPVSWLALKDAV